MRLVLVAIGLAVVLAVPFLIWGDAFDAAFSFERTRDQLEGGWLAGIVLMTIDIVLPMPATVIMTVLGVIYGPLIGGLFSALGAFTSGLVAYGLCRVFGEGVGRRIVGQKELDKGRALLADVGGWAVALSRWMPLLPEVVACVAGLVRLPFGKFAAALACGSLPLGFTFAALGPLADERPALTLTLSAALPAVLWVVVGRILARLSKDETSSSDGQNDSE